MGDTNYVYVEVEEVLAESDKAVLCLIDGEEVWIPFSQIASEDRDGIKKGDKDVGVSITEWIAREKRIGE
jgi:hypothetical protein